LVSHSKERTGQKIGEEREVKMKETRQVRTSFKNGKKWFGQIRQITLMGI
jgi:hypothetical protein